MKYFGTDGIRGEAGVKLTSSLAYNLGKALSKLNNDTVVIAFDTRRIKDMLAYSVAAGAMSMGLDVIIAGVLPTPALIYYSQVKEILGVMITASHNPYMDNGLKVLNNGVKLSEAEELIVEEAIEEDLKSTKIGEVTNFYKSEYINHVEDTYFKLLEQTANYTTDKKVVIDCANGATYHTAPSIFSLVTSDLIVLADNPNGVNVNHGVGSTHLDYIKSEVVKNKAFVGFAFDGDGDRVLAVDENGVTFDGDQLIYIITKYLAKNDQLNKNTVVFTRMSNLGLINKLNQDGIKVSLTDVGDKYVVRELMANNYSVGGENSGHIIMPDILKTGDGTLVALYLLKILEEENKTLSELTKDVIMYKDKMVNLKVKDKSIINTETVQTKVKEIENKLGNNGKVILRASGTENVLRVSVMALTQEIVDENINELVNLIMSFE